MSFPGDEAFLSDWETWWPGGLCCVKRWRGFEQEFGRVEAGSADVRLSGRAGGRAGVLPYPSVKAMIADGWVVD